MQRCFPIRVIRAEAVIKARVVRERVLILLLLLLSAVCPPTFLRREEALQLVALAVIDYRRSSSHRSLAQPGQLFFAQIGGKARGPSLFSLQ